MLLVELIALRDIQTGTGLLVKDQPFQAFDDEAKRYVSQGVAVLASEAKKAGWLALPWQWCDVFILASGESLTEEAAELVRRWRVSGSNRRVICINTSFRRAPWADVLYAGDGAWWDKYHNEVAADFKGALWTQDPDAAKKYKANFVPSRRGRGLCRQPGVLFQGENSGYQALNLAYHAVAPTESNIFLLGYDMKGGHWHGRHPDHLDIRLAFERWIPEFKFIADDLADTNTRVFNCSLDSALPWFDFFELETACAGRL